MNSFDRILKLTEWANKLAKPYPYNPALDSLLETQRQLKRSFSGFEMVENITKKLRLDFGIKPYYFDFHIPKSTLETIELISNQHKQYFVHIKNAQNSLKITDASVTNINSLQVAVKNITNEIGRLAVKYQDWQLLDNFEEFNSQAIELSDSIVEETLEEQELKFRNLLSQILPFLIKHKNIGIYTLRIVEIFLIIAGLHQYLDFLEEKPKLATKEEVNKIEIKQDSVLNFLKEIKKQLKTVNEYRIINRTCKVMLKPKTKTTIITSLPKNFEVTQLQINHKWVLISYFDPKDNLPQTGWVLKKYLKKPKANKTINE
jgi:hypothetical protein